MQHYVKLLESFVFLRITSLLTSSLEDDEELIDDFFRVCLETAKPEHSVLVRSFFEQLVLQLVEESDDISSKSMEILLDPFAHPSKKVYPLYDLC